MATKPNTNTEDAANAAAGADAINAGTTGNDANTSASADNEAAIAAATGAKPKSPTPPKTKTVRGLRIKSKREGFRRAGRAWGTQATDVRLDELTKDQVAALKAESMLMVEAIDIEIPAA